MKLIHRSDARSGTLLGLVIGLVLGVLLALLVVPARQDSRALVSGAGGQVGGASGPGGTPADGGPGIAVDPATGGPDSGGGAGGRRGAARSEGAVGDRAGGSGQGGPGGPVRGVTANKIRIGIAYPDLSAFAALGESYKSGDQPKQWEAVLDGWRRRGAVPVHGRDIELVYRSFNILDANTQRAACVGLVQDDKVFAVVATWFFGVGMECVAKEFATPLLTQGDPLAVDDFYRRLGSNFFTVAMSTDRMYRNWIHWAGAHRLLAGRRIGIYAGSDPGSRYLVATVKAELARFGQKPVAEVTTDTPTTGGPQDAVAVQRFRAERVDLALLMVSSIAQTNFMQQADAQGYRPTYIENDFGSATSNAAASTKPASQYDGSLAMTQTTNGEAGAGRPVAPQAEACMKNYERHSASSRPTRETAEWGYILLSCDLGRVLLAGLTNAGATLDRARYIAGIEAIRAMAMDRHAPVSFRPDKHHGVELQRTIQWRGGCTCWATVENEFQPLWVP